MSYFVTDPKVKKGQAAVSRFLYILEVFGQDNFKLFVCQEA